MVPSSPIAGLEHTNPPVLNLHLSVPFEFNAWRELDIAAIFLIISLISSSSFSDTGYGGYNFPSLSYASADPTYIVPYFPTAGLELTGPISSNRHFNAPSTLRAQIHPMEDVFSCHPVTYIVPSFPIAGLDLTLNQP